MTFTPRDNPFSMCYTGIVKLLLANKHFNRMVETSNLIRFDAKNKRDPLKSVVEAGDLCEVIVSQDGMAMNLGQTSTTTMVLKRYSILLSTGDKRINDFLNQVQWEIFVCMSNWKSVITPLQWRGAGFVKRAAVLDVSEGLSDPAANRKIEGWSAVWRCEIEMHFKKTDILSLLS
jgi:hypothetical protein